MSLATVLSAAVAILPASPPQTQQKIGNVWAWGSSGYGGGVFGAKPTGGSQIKRTPVQLADLSGVTAIAGSDFDVVVLKGDGTVWASNYDPQATGMSASAANSRTEITEVENLSGILAIAAGRLYSLALKRDGTVWAWGGDYNGVLGIGTQTRPVTLPVQVHTISRVVAIAAGNSFSLALERDGTVWAWGDNSSGQLGNGSTTNSDAPVQVRNLSGVIAVAAASSYSLALKRDGTVWTWGFNATTNSNSPVEMSGLSDVTAIAAGEWHSLALKSDGTVWAWGLNSFGQLGNGKTADSRAPVQVSNLSGVTAIAACYQGYHSLALEKDGTVWAWGSNEQGQLGDGKLEDSNTPVQVTNLSRVIGIASGSDYSLAVALPVLTNRAPAITSVSAITFHVGQPGYFTVTAGGFPVPSLTESGTLPGKVTFVDNGNGTGTLQCNGIADYECVRIVDAGNGLRGIVHTPAAGTGETYKIAITAQNGVGPSATQNFTLTLN